MPIDYSKMPVKLQPASRARRLSLASYVSVDSVSVPESVDYAKNVPNFPMLMNDRIGCCGIAGPAHQIQAWTCGDDDSPDFMPTDDQVVREYGVYGGYPHQDGGVVLMDVLKGWQSRGLFGGHKIEAFAGIEPTNRKLNKWAIAKLGGTCIGLRMPKAWQQAEDWQAPTSPSDLRRPEWQPDSWGGHCVEPVAYDPKWVYAVTWGAIKRISWHAFETYCDESFGMVSKDWTGKNGVNSSTGIKLERMLRDVKNIQQAGPLSPTISLIRITRVS